MKVIVLTYESGLEECIYYNLDAIEYLQGVINLVTDLRVFTVEKIVHESTEKIIELKKEA